jgi:Ca-activated chloride channel family protein
MKKLLLTSALAVITCLGLVTCFGDNVRALFGTSASALAGETAVARRARGDALEKKKLMNFSGDNSYGGPPSSPGFVAVAPNSTTDTRVDHLSTFAIDVDTASYTYARRMLLQGQRPEPASVRVEEWVNAFHYALEAPKDAPFAIHVEGAPSGAGEGSVLLKVSLQGRRVANADRKPAHLVFLVDTSGSMSGADRLPLARQALALLTEHLNPRDTVAIATYAGDSRVVLEPTSATNQRAILAAIASLGAGGGTNMGSGLQLAYDMAVRQVRAGEVSRVLVLTDGDANLGTTTTAGGMLAAIKGYVDEGVTMTTVGFGLGNYKAAQLEELADKGNGQALYVDSLDTAKKVFVDELSGTIEHIARDVKVQVNFDPAVVSAYRLVGYENRAVADGDFRNDSVDGGELGAGHSVTALYELTLAPGASSLGTVSVRGLHPDTRAPFELTQVMTRSQLAPNLNDASTELRFATAVALAADHLRGNPRSSWTLERLVELARGAANGQAERLEFVALLQAAREPSRPVAAYRSQPDLSGY